MAVADSGIVITGNVTLNGNLTINGGAEHVTADLP
jgi:hypothetical protein